VDWGLKKKIGPLAYFIAGLKALREQKPKIIVHAEGREVRGELVLIGNGRFYAGSFGVFHGSIGGRRFAVFQVCSRGEDCQKPLCNAFARRPSN